MIAHADEKNVSEAGYLIARIEGAAWRNPATGRLCHLRGWTLQGPDGHYLFIGEHGCIAPTKREAIEEALARIADETRYETAEG